MRTHICFVQRRTILIDAKPNRVILTFNRPPSPPYLPIYPAVVCQEGGALASIAHQREAPSLVRFPMRALRHEQIFPFSQLNLFSLLTLLSFLASFAGLSRPRAHKLHSQSLSHSSPFTLPTLRPPFPPLPPTRCINLLIMHFACLIRYPSKTFLHPHTDLFTPPSQVVAQSHSCMTIPFHYISDPSLI